MDEMRATQAKIEARIPGWTADLTDKPRPATAIATADLRQRLAKRRAELGIDGGS